MPRLAERRTIVVECSPFFTAQARWSFPVAAAGFDAARLMPAGSGLTIPHIKGVPLELQLWHGHEAAARLASTLLDADIADSSDWVHAKRNPLDFVKRAVDRWLAIHHAETIREQFFLDVTLSTSLDHCTPRENGPESLARMYLAIEPESAGYVVLGPALRLLESVHPRLPAAFANLFLGGLNRWVRVYDYHDARERIEMLREWYASDPEAGEVELPDIERSIPNAIRNRPVGERILRRIIPSIADPLARRLMEGAMELDLLSKQARRPDVADDVREHLMDCGEPVPALVAVFEANDAIEGAFDEERHGMLELMPEPNVLIPFNGEDPSSAAEAFSVLSVLCGTLACASRLIGIMPGQPVAVR